MVDWRKIRKIDAHIHILPKEVHDANPDSEDEFSYAKVDEHIKIMNQYNIEKSVIMPFNDSFLMSNDFNVSAVHRNLEEICESFLGRYVAFVDIDTRSSAEQSYEEIKTALKSEYCKGLKIHPSNTGMNADDIYNDIVVRAVLEADVPVAIHSYPSDDKMDCCSPTRISKLMQRHPELKVIVCHMGGFQWTDVLKLNAFVEISAILPDYVSKYGIKETNRILREFGVERLIFGTDWPCSRSLQPTEIYERYFEVLNDMDFNASEAEQIAYWNIKELLKV